MEISEGQLSYFSIPTIALLLMFSNFINNDIIVYPIFASILSLLIFFIWAHLPINKLSYLNRQHTKVMDISVFLLILLTVYFSRLYPEIEYFILMPVIVGSILTFRILYGKTNYILNLIQIILLGVVSRGGLFFSYEVYGPDLFHLYVPAWIMETGHLIPKSVTYYKDYPLSHVLGALGGLIMNVSGRHGMFLTVGVVQVIGFIGVYFIVFRLSKDQRLALTSQLVVCLSAGPMMRGSNIFAQTYAGALFPILIYMIIMGGSNKKMGLFLLLTGAAFFGHHSIAFSLSLTIIFLYIGYIIIQLFPDLRDKEIGHYKNSYIPVALSVILVTISYYWLEIGQMRGQINRVGLILSITQATGSEAIEQTTSGSPPSVEIFGSTLPVILSWGAPLLILIVLVAIAGCISVSYIFTPLTLNFPGSYLIASFAMFSVFGISYLIGGNVAVIRLLPAVTVVVAPLFAFIGKWVFPKKFGRPLLIGIVVLCIISGIFTPWVAIAERPDDDYSPIISNTEYAAGNWAQSHSTEIASGDGMVSFLEWNSVGNGDNMNNYQAVLIRSKPENLTQYQSHWQSESVFIYRSRYSSYYKLKQPNDKNLVYNSGTKIYKL